MYIFLFLVIIYPVGMYYFQYRVLFYTRRYKGKYKNSQWNFTMHFIINDTTDEEERKELIKLRNQMHLFRWVVYTVFFSTILYHVFIRELIIG